MLRKFKKNLNFKNFEIRNLAKFDTPQNMKNLLI